MKRIPLLITASVIVSFAVPALSLAATAQIKSLRGDATISETNTPVNYKPVLKPEEGFGTTWSSQPPSIPHEIHEDKVTLKENTCMNCHAKENYKKEGSVKIGKSHYYGRDGERSNTLAPRRYFCVQCHTPQLDTKALVENTFIGDEE